MFEEFDEKIEELASEFNLKFFELFKETPNEKVTVYVNKKEGIVLVTQLIVNVSPDEMLKFEGFSGKSECEKDKQES